MNKHRGLLIYTGLLVTLGGAWIAASIHYRLPWWWILAGSLTVAAIAQVGEWAVLRNRRPARRRRRAHAR